MRSKRVVLQRVAAFCVVVLLGAVGLSGCSSVEPTDAGTDAVGTVSGRVQSDQNNLLTGIDVWITSEWNDCSYSTDTNASGEYVFESLPMSTRHSFSETYDVCFNRSPENGQRINQDYSTWSTTVTVTKGEVSTLNAVLTYVGDEPGDPQTYIDD